jgi:oxygen-independent coproporphyrinogen-3 oxidase
MPMKGLYIHIPFCARLCTYCDFAKEIAKTDKQTAYIDALIKELHYYKADLKHLTTIYIGGGTPSALNHTDLTRLLEAITMIVDVESVIEYTVECNPNDIDNQLASLLKTYGVNRISMGVQTFNNDHLAFLNRTHKQDDIVTAFKVLRDHRFKNISVDMMFGLVNQTLAEVDSDISALLTLNPNHISYYSLILEDNTKLHHLVSQGVVTMIDEDLEADMYELIIKRLKEASYQHYEISNFARNGYESLHNTIYWKNADYIGLGAGSHGKYNDTRYYNERRIKHYIEAVNDKGCGLATTYPYEALRDTFLMGLRRLEGIHIPTVEETFNINIFETYSDVKKHMADGLLEIENDYLRFTDKGLMLANIVFMSF